MRTLTNALLDQAGYTIGKYVSLEQLVAESADDYYAALLLTSTHGWHEAGPGPDPTIRLMLEQLKVEDRIMPDGRGRSAVWVKAPGSV